MALQHAEAPAAIAEYTRPMRRIHKALRRTAPFCTTLREPAVRGGRLCRPGSTTTLLGLLAFVLASSTTCLEARAREAGQPRTIDSVAACSNVESPPVPEQGVHSDDHLFATPPNPEGPTLVDLGLLSFSFSFERFRT